MEIFNKEALSEFCGFEVLSYTADKSKRLITMEGLKNKQISSIFGLLVFFDDTFITDSYNV